VWGSPSSGKTTFSITLAQSIYSEYNCTVIVLFTDYDSPVIPSIFPNHKKEDISSVGIPLSKTEVTADEVVKHIVTVKGKVNLGFLGFMNGENLYTYPRLDNSKISSLLSVLKDMADFVIVDCTSNLNNPISVVSVCEADIVFRLASTDLKSISFYNSQLPLLSNVTKYYTSNQIQGLNVTDGNIFTPVDELKSYFSDVSFVLPYSNSVKTQMLEGNLYEKVNDKKFNKVMKTIVEKVVNE
jgi:MinD-like ATPase involved in chromosome partitioning or flagellar assembly